MMTRTPADTEPHLTWTLVDTFYFGENTTSEICKRKTEPPSWAEKWTWVTDPSLITNAHKAKEPLGLTQLTGRKRRRPQGLPRPAQTECPKCRDMLWRLRSGQEVPQGV